MSIQRLRVNQFNGQMIEAVDGHYVHWATFKATTDQLVESFDRERQLYQSQIDTLTALLKRPS